MKKLFIALLFCISNNGLLAQSSYSKDVSSVSNIVETLYAVISGGPNEERDWNRFANLFMEESRLIPTGKSKEGSLNLRSITPDQYIELFKNNIKVGFYEKELHQEVQEYGTIAHVFSTYETAEEPNGKVNNRGINSIQLFKDSARYYIISIFWCAESMGFPLPQKYLK